MEKLGKILVVVFFLIFYCIDSAILSPFQAKSQFQNLLGHDIEKDKRINYFKILVIIKGRVF